MYVLVGVVLEPTPADYCSEKNQLSYSSSLWYEHWKRGSPCHCLYYPFKVRINYSGQYKKTHGPFTLRGILQTQVSQRVHAVRYCGDIQPGASSGLGSGGVHRDAVGGTTGAAGDDGCGLAVTIPQGGDCL